MDKLKISCSATLLAMSLLAAAPGAFANDGYGRNTQDSGQMGQSGSAAGAPDSGSQASGGGVQVKQSNAGIRYASGGVGETEDNAFRKAASDYSLNLLFTTEQGRYMAGVKTVVKKKNGTEILSTVSDGPWLLAELPPGAYTVEASAEGKSFTRKVDVKKGKPTKVILRWPAAKESP